MPPLKRNPDAPSASFSFGKPQTVYTVVSLICISALAFMIGFRAKAFRRQRLRFAQILVLIQTILGVSYVVSSAILVALGLVSQAQCYAAIIICLVFYTSAKLALYLFLLERAHVVRAPFVKNRFQDWIWVVGIVVIVVGWGAISIVCFITPQAYISVETGQCHIGTAAIPSYLMLAFDVFINLSLTVIFVVLLRRVLQISQSDSSTIESSDESRTRAQRSLARILFLGKEAKEPVNSRFWKSVHALLWKNTIGSTLIFLASAANMIVFYVNGIQLGWLCLVCCISDVTWGILVVHWLTIGSSENERNISASTLDNSRSSVSTISGSVHAPPSAPAKGSICTQESAASAEKKEDEIL